MKRKLAIASYNWKTSAFLESLIGSIFGEYVDIETYSIKEKTIEAGIMADLIVISSFTVFEEVKKYVKNDAEIIISNYTLTKEGFGHIKNLPSGTKAMLVNLNAKVCMETITLIYQLGCRGISLVPVYPGLIDLPDISLAITPGETKIVPEKVKAIIDIGERVLDMNTIADIAVKLNLQRVLNNPVVKKYFDEIMPVSYGLEKTLGENISLNSQQNILLEILEQGIIIINSIGVILACNESAEKMLNISGEEAVGKNYVKIIPQIQFNEVLESLSPTRSQLVKVNDIALELSIFPITSEKVPYGAVAILNRFTEVEKKQHKLRAQLLNRGHLAKYTFDDILGKSEAICQCKSIAKRMADSEAAVLITSESGTGKELFAQGIHNASKRNEYQFVAINCAALSESLLESELFGYEGGAFTGAKKEGKLGMFELAHNGTLFLDEIGDMPLILQARLLRTLQEKTVMRLGGENVINVNVRIICATNKDLKELVAQNKFRNDLYYRISVLPLSIPPLRERKDDIMILADSFKKEYDASFRLNEEAKKKMQQYDWPGNVRELRNYMEYFSNIGKPVIEVGDLPFHNKKEVEHRVLSKNTRPHGESGINELFKRNTKDLDSYIIILKLLEYSYESRIKIGRRGLSTLASEEGVYLSEQEIRSILLKLESYGFVEISKGRAGTKITAAGRQVLNEACME